MVTAPEGPGRASCDPSYGKLAGLAFGEFEADDADRVRQIHWPRGRTGGRARRQRRGSHHPGSGLGRRTLVAHFLQSAQRRSPSPPASTPASDESSISTSPTSRSSSTTPISTTSPEHSTDDESGGFTKSGASASPSQTVTTDESGVIVRSSGGAHTSGTDNQSDLEQRITPEEEVALQAPPEKQVTTPPAVPTRTDAPTKKNSDTKKVAPLTAPTLTVAPTEKNSDTKKVAPRSADAPAVGTEMGDAGLQLRSSATAGKNDEWNDQSVGATFTTPPASASSARVLVDLIDDDRGRFRTRVRWARDSSVTWAVLGWVRRHFTERFANRTPVADLAQTTQVEPLDPAQAAPVEELSALVAADPPIDAGVAADAGGAGRASSADRGADDDVNLLRNHPESR